MMLQRYILAAAGAFLALMCHNCAATAYQVVVEQSGATSQAQVTYGGFVHQGEYTYLSLTFSRADPTDPFDAGYTYEVVLRMRDESEVGAATAPRMLAGWAFKYTGHGGPSLWRLSSGTLLYERHSRSQMIARGKLLFASADVREESAEYVPVSFDRVVLDRDRKFANRILTKERVAVRPELEAWRDAIENPCTPYRTSNSVNDDEAHESIDE